MQAVQSLTCSKRQTFILMSGDKGSFRVCTMFKLVSHLIVYNSILVTSAKQAQVVQQQPWQWGQQMAICNWGEAA